MNKLSKIKYLILCLIVAVVSFAFACDFMGGNGGGSSTEVTLEQYVNNGKIKNYKTYGDVKVDGLLDDEVWQKQLTLNRELVVGGSNYAVEISGYLAETGVVMYIDVVTDGGVYINKLRTDHYNTSMEVYLTSGDKSVPEMNTWELPMLANGRFDSRLFTWEGFLRDAKCYMDVETQIYDKDRNPLPKYDEFEDVNLSPDETSGYSIE